MKQRARKIKEGRQRRETEEANRKLEEEEANSKMKKKDQADDKRSADKNEKVAAATNIVSRISRKSEQNLKEKEEKLIETDKATKGKRTRREVGGGSSSSNSNSREVIFLLCRKCFP